MVWCMPMDAYKKKLCQCANVEEAALNLTVQFPEDDFIFGESDSATVPDQQYSLHYSDSEMKKPCVGRQFTQVNKTGRK